ncbi:hypothetical protein [Neisseria montereyensis]|uniref:Lipoprotein n=1 Tax=Neisseria montereyensis TaxID=2973938 RepID=A0ABT2FDT5_9NEIS|nr:hypothetical protein [Neisseria montereyensis]MCS4534076.1 hypothetical protein [Neisseria montereyensis]
MKNLMFILFSGLMLIACQQQDDAKQKQYDEARKEVRKTDKLKQPYKYEENLNK